MKPMTEQHLAVLRRHMVEIVDMHYDLNGEDIGKDEVDPDLRRALLDVPRHLFVPDAIAAYAYHDTPLPIGFDKTLSQPFIGALMIDLLEVEPGHRVLEVGTGLGYQAAALAELGASVFTVEVVEEFAVAASGRFSALGYDVKVRTGDGTRGWAEHAPFERILVTAAAAEVPAALFEQLAPGGLIVMPLGGQDVQQLCVIERDDEGDVTVRPVMLVRFTQLETVI